MLSAVFDLAVSTGALDFRPGPVGTVGKGEGTGYGKNDQQGEGQLKRQPRQEPPAGLPEPVSPEKMTKKGAVGIERNPMDEGQPLVAELLQVAEQGGNQADCGEIIKNH